MHGHFDDGAGQLYLCQSNGMFLRRERVVRVRVTKLGDATDVAGVKSRYLDPLAALRDRQMVQLLRRVARRVHELFASRNRSGVEAEERHVAHVWLSGGLED